MTYSDVHFKYMRNLGMRNSKLAWTNERAGLELGLDLHSSPQSIMLLCFSVLSIYTIQYKAWVTIF